MIPGFIPVVSKILAASEDITSFPFSGRIVPEIGDKNIREKLVHIYRVVYQVEKARIVILAVIHGKLGIDNFTKKFIGS